MQQEPHASFTAAVRSPRWVLCPRFFSGGISGNMRGFHFKGLGPTDMRRRPQTMDHVRPTPRRLQSSGGLQLCPARAFSFHKRLAGCAVANGAARLFRISVLGNQHGQERCVGARDYCGAQV